MQRQFYSKPQYRTLDALPERPHHVVIADSIGVEFARRLLADVDGDCSFVIVDEVQPASAEDRCVRIASSALAGYLAARLPQWPAGTGFYLFGREAFAWPVQNLLQDLCVPRSQCEVQRCGPLVRDVVCMHCRHTNRDVRETLVDCGGCARVLSVYDHFSRRLGCYMGFQANAECERDLPPRALLRA